MRRVLVVTDAWRPQVNGVVRSLERLVAEAPALGAEVLVLGPDGFRTLPLPGYPGLRVALPAPGEVGRRIEAARAGALHVATEGPLGLAARGHALRRGLPFTTSYHTRFPDYAAARVPVALAPAVRALGHVLVRRFHAPAAQVMVATAALEAELAGRGFARLARWPRGVDARLFRPRPGDETLARLAGHRPRPYLLSVGRLAVEKNLPAFLGADAPGTKLVVGDGPEAARLRAAHPEAVFLGGRRGEELAAIYAGADAFAFPSLTDTFGLVVLEALASGVPVAAYPTPVTAEILGVERLGTAPCGVLRDDLGAALRGALALPRAAARARAEAFTWEASARRFLANLEPAAAAPRRGSVPLRSGAGASS